jgi:hypothetical protein
VPAPLIDGVLYRHSYAILRGRDSTYKSFIALDWALSIAAGKKWQGNPTAAGRVLYIAGEGAYGIAKRVAAWKASWGAIRAGSFVLRRQAVNLYRAGPAFDDLLSRVSKGKYDLVIIDTLRRASGGADGNASDMGVVVDNLTLLREATESGCVLVVAHTDKSDTDTRGYSGIEDDADIVWHAKREEGVQVVELTNTKMKDTDEGAVFELAAVKSLESLVLQVHRDSDDMPAEGHAADQRVMSAMRDIFSTTGASMAELVMVTGLSNDVVYQARGRLESGGSITVIKKGFTSHVYLPGRSVPV